MTTYAKTEITCGACGQPVACNVIVSTSTFGSPDLDTRPPQMQRSTMGAWVRRCLTCGYCSYKLETFDRRLRKVVDCSAYQTRLADKRLPELANTYLCAGMLAEEAGQTEASAWACLHAAWVLDDTDNDDQARIWRGRAGELFLTAALEGQVPDRQTGVIEATAIDCLRRAGRGQDALRVIGQLLGMNCDKTIRRILKFQQTLIERGDTGRYLIRDAFKHEM